MPYRVFFDPQMMRKDYFGNTLGESIACKENPYEYQYTDTMVYKVIYNQKPYQMAVKITIKMTCNRESCINFTRSTAPATSRH
jgi:hypothetical protein